MRGQRATGDHGEVVKLAESTGVSAESFSDTVRNAVKEAAKTIRDITAWR